MKSTKVFSDTVNGKMGSSVPYSGLVVLLSSLVERLAFDLGRDLSVSATTRGISPYSAFTATSTGVS
jgi:hypothetical protein